MSNTKKKFKGESYRPKDRKKLKDKMWFGFTDGTHRPVIAVKDGNRIFGDEAMVKGKDFIKYGWPFEIRHKSVIRRNLLEKEAKEQIKRINEDDGN